MNKNEKKLFYLVISEQIKEDSSSELALKIMHTVHNYAKKRDFMHRIWELFGYSLLCVLSLVFVGIYLIYYTDFRLPAFHLHIEKPSTIYVGIFTIILVFLLIEMYFRRKLYRS